MAEIVFSKHAVEQMLARKISPEEVEMVIQDPEGSLEQSRDKQVFYRRFSKRKDNLIAAVVVRQTVNQREVITVMHNFEVKS